MGWAAEEARHVKRLLEAGNIHDARVILHTVRGAINACDPDWREIEVAQ